MRALIACLCLLAAIPLSGEANAAKARDERAAFIAEAFSAGAPAPRVLWLTPALRAEMKRRLGEEMKALRVRYWRQGMRTAWILDEVGKEEPITAGVVVEEGRIEAMSVLVYREARGFEIRYPYFREQFLGAALTLEGELDASIDGISGATLSVRAMTAMARRALFLHDAAMREKP